MATTVVDLVATARVVSQAVAIDSHHVVAATWRGVILVGRRSSPIQRRHAATQTARNFVQFLETVPAILETDLVLTMLLNQLLARAVSEEVDDWRQNMLQVFEEGAHRGRLP